MMKKEAILDAKKMMTNDDQPLSISRAKAKKEWEIDPLKLVIKGVIARGSFGVIHRGLYLQNPVAVKVIDFGGAEEGISEIKVARMEKDFRQEVTVWSKLDHPNVTKMIGVTMCSGYNLKRGKAKNRATPTKSAFCIVAEYVEGGSLRSHLRKNRFKKLPYSVVIQFALDIARGLSYLHSKKIVHRDVKTDNMLFDKKRTVKLTDFGVSEVEDGDPVGIVGETGTCGYMAPEVRSGYPYDHKCDVYSFGICLWEIYCCEMPYSYLTYSLEDIPVIVYKDMRPNIPRCCPRSLARLMEWCWETDPKRRPEMETVVRELEEIEISEDFRMSSVDPPLGCFCFFNR